MVTMPMAIALTQVDAQSGICHQIKRPREEDRKAISPVASTTPVSPLRTNSGMAAILAQKIDNPDAPLPRPRVEQTQCAYTLGSRVTFEEILGVRDVPEQLSNINPNS